MRVRVCSFDECVSKLTPFLKTSGYNVAKHVSWVPISALTGANVLEPISKEKCPWYDGKTLIATLDELVIGGRNPDAPLRIPVLDKFVDRGTVSPPATGVSFVPTWCSAALLALGVACFCGTPHTLPPISQCGNRVAPVAADCDGKGGGRHRARWLCSACHAGQRPWSRGQDLCERD